MGLGEEGSEEVMDVEAKAVGSKAMVVRAEAD